MALTAQHDDNAQGTRTASVGAILVIALVGLVASFARSPSSKPFMGVVVKGRPGKLYKHGCLPNASNGESGIGYLRIATQGGIGNQRECIINGALLARKFGLRLVTPPVYPIWHEHQDYLKSHGSNASYLPPFQNRSEWGRFGLVFDEGVFVGRLGSVGVPVVSAAPKGATVTTVERMPALSDLIANETLCLSDLGNGNRPGVAPWSPRVYEIDERKICYDLAVTRGESAACARFGPNGSCHAATSSLVLASPVRRVVERVVDKVVATRAAATHWHAVHINTWPCEAGATHNPKGRPTVAKFRSDVLDVVRAQVVDKMRRSVTTEGVYFLSQLRGAEFEAAAQEVFPHAVWKDEVLPNISSEYPFEVVAQIDFETAFSLVTRTDGMYFGQFGHSSSDDFLLPRLIERGVQTHTLAPRAACDCTAGCRR